MEKIVVRGGTRLNGTVTVSGAKNAAVAIIPATILADGPCIIENIPNISDVQQMVKIISNLGATIKVINRNTLSIDCTTIDSHIADDGLARKMRASYYLVGALLGKFGRAKVSMPGGCEIGVRPIDQHIKGFEALGASVDINHGLIDVSAEKLVGTSVYLDMASVGATINIMLAAVRAEGMTYIENAAKEPHIVDVANFLNSMGANIKGAGTDTIKIQGVETLHGGQYSIIPDQIEAGTYMVAAAAAGGRVVVRNVIPKHMEHLSAKLTEAGAEVTELDDAIIVERKGPLEKINLKTMPYPGFPTDLQPQMAVMLTIANGTSMITESVWDNRFKYVDELAKMGANIKVDGKVAVIEGVDHLTSAPLKACDLRAGAAMIIAGICAQGTSEIEDIEHIERGYEDYVGKFSALGADIKKMIVPDTHVVPKAN